MPEQKTIMRQISLLGADEQAQETKYTMAVGSPVYVPKDRKPSVLELFNSTFAHSLMRDVDKSTVTPEEKLFLLSAARRHVVFNYELIADYYAHATPEMQRLMEDSALVIPDFDRAIELGYVSLCDAIRKQYLEEQSGDE